MAGVEQIAKEIIDKLTIPESFNNVPRNYIEMLANSDYVDCLTIMDDEARMLKLDLLIDSGVLTWKQAKLARKYLDKKEFHDSYKDLFILIGRYFNLEAYKIVINYFHKLAKDYINDYESKRN